MAAFHPIDRFTLCHNDQCLPFLAVLTLLSLLGIFLPILSKHYCAITISVSFLRQGQHTTGNIVTWFTLGGIILDKYNSSEIYSHLIFLVESFNATEL
jgi:hypothetical protein